MKTNNRHLNHFFKKFHFIVFLIFLFVSGQVYAQWVQSGLNGNRIQALAENESKIYAGTYGIGVYLSVNKGSNWSSANSGITNNFIRSFYLSGTDLFVGTYGGGAFRSSNNGSNWISVNSGLTNPYILDFTSIGSYLFAASEPASGGIFRSSNNGLNWITSSSGIPSTIVHALVSNGTNLFAGTNGSGVYISTNSGASWSAVNNGITDTYIYDLAVNASTIFAGSSSGIIFISTNNGSNWSGINVSSISINTFAVSGQYIFAGGFGGGVLLSTNNGLNWIAVNTGLTDTDVRSLVVSGLNLYAGTFSSGVWKRPLSEIITSLTKTLSLTMLMQGFYNESSNTLNRDTVRVYLRNNSAPYAIKDSAKAFLNSSGSGTFTFSNALNYTPYYIQIKHRNSIETWSKNPEFFTNSSLDYDFTTASTKAYGNNMIQADASPVRFAVYGGDINQDGTVDAGDLSAVENAAVFSLTGYEIADVTGDDFVDVSDVSIVENNAAISVSVVSP